MSQNSCRNSDFGAVQKIANLEILRARLTSKCAYAQMLRNQPLRLLSEAAISPRTSLQTLLQHRGPKWQCLGHLIEIFKCRHFDFCCRLVAASKRRKFRCLPSLRVQRDVQFVRGWFSQFSFSQLWSCFLISPVVQMVEWDHSGKSNSAIRSFWY